MIRGKARARVVVVGDFLTDRDFEEQQIFSGQLGDLMDDVMGSSGFSTNNIVYVPSLPVTRETAEYYNNDKLLRESNNFLLPFLDLGPRDVVVALGNVALFCTGCAEKPEGINTVRSKILKSKFFDTPVVASTNPYFIARTPDDIEDFCSDMKFACRVAAKDPREQVRVEIIDLKTPEDVVALLKAARRTGSMAYDFETTGLDQFTDYPVTAGFCCGEKNADGAYIGYFWAGYDRGQQIEDKELAAEMRKAFAVLLRNAGRTYQLIGHNTLFDDWMAEGWLGLELPGSQHDTQFMKWVVNNNGFNNLKDAVYRYLGFPRYDDNLTQAVKDVKARRNRILVEDEDLYVLGLYGVDPEISKSGKPKWPKSIDKGAYAYAMVDLETLRTYNVYDAVYTFMLFNKFSKIIEEEGLQDSYALRLEIAHETKLAEKRGMVLNREAAEEFERQLDHIWTECKDLIQIKAKEIDPTIEEFNPASPPQLSRLLFGEPDTIPFIDLSTVSSNKRNWTKLVDKIHQQFYGDFSDVVEAIRSKSFDYEFASQELIKEFTKWTRCTVKTAPQNIWCTGLYEPLAFTKKGQPSCANVVMQALYHSKPNDLLKLILMYRKAEKMNSVFVRGILKKVDKYNVLRPHYRVDGTKSGRLSCVNPNAQQWPEAIRGIMEARPGTTFYHFDFSQAEIRTIAAYSGDPDLLEAIAAADRGDAKDIHYSVAGMILGKPADTVTKEERRQAKTIVFGIIYGMGALKLGMAIGKTEDEAQAFIDKLFDTFPKMKEWLDAQTEIATNKPYYTTTVWGTRRSTRNALSISGKERGHALRVATNHPIQGSAGEYSLWSICEIMKRCRERGLKVWFVNTIHDSCTFEVAKEEVELLDSVVDEVIGMPAPREPLNKVKFVVDKKVDDQWYGAPNLKLALDPKEEIFEWSLIKPYENLDQAEIEELEEIEQVATLNA